MGHQTAQTIAMRMRTIAGQMLATVESYFAIKANAFLKVRSVMGMRTAMTGQTRTKTTVAHMLAPQDNYGAVVIAFLKNLSATLNMTADLRMNTILTLAPQGIVAVTMCLAKILLGVRAVLKGIVPLRNLNVPTATVSLYRTLVIIGMTAETTVTRISARLQH